MADSFPHLFLKNHHVRYDFKLPGSGGSINIPDRNRVQHADHLLNELDSIFQSDQAQKEQRTEEGLSNRNGIYLEFVGKPGFDLLTKQMEFDSKDIRILNIKEDEGELATTRAVLHVPDAHKNHFVDKIRNYKLKDTRFGRPENADLVNSIEDIQVGTLLNLWTDQMDLFPGDIPVWCELWIYCNYDIEKRIQELMTCCQSTGIELKETPLHFPEREVFLIKANRVHLEELLMQYEYVSELRRLKETAGFWLEERNVSQLQWIRDLLSRTTFNFPNDIGICILDTGINNAHELLAPVLHQSDCHAVKLEWGVNDHKGHGTLMAGVAVYGDLVKIFESQDKIEISHKLSSVKILPPSGHNDPDLHGVLTINAVSRAEIQAASRVQHYCMAVTSKEKIYRGRPTSWSSAIDQLSVGTFDDTKRLFIISAGNVREASDYLNYHNSNLTISAEDPAQSWNALTVGAITDKIVTTDPNFNGHSPLATNYGELSPFSSTSLNWEKRKWPNKPDIVLEGGNILKAPDNSITGCTDDFALLSTSYRPINNQFDSFYGTSAATAQAAWLAAKLQTFYPNSWPETIRGLIIHSARWTDGLVRQLGIDESKKSDIATLMRVSGYGAPDFEKALNGSISSFTLVAEESLYPFGLSEDRKRIVVKDMHLYEFPWPKELLLGLGNTKVKMRVTLSYFVDPAPGEMGWKDKYRYQSFGLRFDLNTSTESKEDFLARVNVLQREENNNNNAEITSDRWKIGVTARNLGSVHSDYIESTAAEIATCNMIAIYPVYGWWRDRKSLSKWNNKARYSLIVSLETPEETIDIYNPVYNLISTPVPVRI